MSEQEEPRVKLPPVVQIGIVVEDVNKSIDYYTSTFGWGPFSVHDIEMKGATYRGKKCDCKLRIAFYRPGSVEIELIQPLEGDTLYNEFLREKGEGLQHLRFDVDDLQGTLAELAKDGIQPVFHHSFPEAGISFAYLDTDRVGGVMFELLESKPPPKK